jgi:hypothetical protein
VSGLDAGIQEDACKLLENAAESLEQEAERIGTSKVRPQNHTLGCWKTRWYISKDR